MNTTVYDCLANTYTITRDKVYVLQPMEKKLFKVWRKDRLRSIKEREKAKKELESVAIFSADQGSAEVTGSKPRTVFLQGREDDTATPIYNTVDSYVAPKYEEVFSCLLAAGNFNHTQEIDSTDACYVGSRERKVHQNFIRINVTTFSTRKGSNSVGSWLFGLISQTTIQNQISREPVHRWLFLFFPRKENQAIRILLICEVLSLCAMGWGPPLQMKRKGRHGKLGCFWSRSIYFLIIKYFYCLTESRYRLFCSLCSKLVRLIYKAIESPL
jgi:hypothetical protein